MTRLNRRTQASNYLRKRAMELATPTTRALTDPLGAWATKRIRLDGIPFSFEGHEYLRAIYDDTAPHIVLSKAAQIGGTTYGILRSIHACIQGLNVMYYFPTRTDVLDFSRSRVGPLLDDNPFLAKLMTDTDTVGLKRIQDAHLFFRGMKSTTGMKSVPADMLVFDELDEAPPDARTLALERLAHSSFKRIIELSNPSLPGYGIDAQYDVSDQRHWTVKCPACGHWTALDKEFPLKLGQEVRIILPRPDGTYYRACPKCEAELDLSQGEWVPDFPDRPIHGYRISQLFSATVDPGAILEEYRTTRYPEQFYRLKIGVPWADLHRRVDAATVLALCGDLEPDDPQKHEFFMGVDTGKDLHLVVLRVTRGQKKNVEVYFLHKMEPFEDLDIVMEELKIRRCVIDGLPEVHKTKEFVARHRRKVFMSFFKESQRGGPAWDRDRRIVNMNRTEALDMSRAVVREGRVLVDRTDPYIREFAAHMACDAKVLEEDEDTGQKKYKYIRTGENHFSMAFTYALMATISPSRRRKLHVQ